MDSNGKAFKSLQAEWDRKLKESGFKDIESRKDPYGPVSDANEVPHADGTLIEYTDSEFQSQTINTQESYYEDLLHFARNEFRATPLRKEVLELYAGGMSMSQIVAHLKATKRPRSYNFVRYTLERGKREFRKRLSGE